VPELVDTIGHQIPAVIGFVAILVAGWIVARVLSGVVRAALRGRTARLSALVARASYYTVLLLVLQAAFGLLGPSQAASMLHEGI
jgi:hypothetical protein